MDLYSEIILDYYKHPRNKGEMAACDAQAEEHNPLCGDKIKVQLQIENDQIIKAQYSGEGCAISQAATSMLTEHIEGKTLEEVKSMETQDILDLLGLDISPGRIKCALLGLATTKKALILHKHA